MPKALVSAILLMMLLASSGCARSASSPTSKPNAPTSTAAVQSADATAAIEGRWKTADPRKYDLVEFSADGEIVQWSTKGTAPNGGTWSFDEPNVIFCELQTSGSGITWARYRCAFDGDSLTLTWLGSDKRKLPTTTHKWGPWLSDTKKPNLKLTRQ